VPREQLWGSKVSGYLFTKSISAGAMPAVGLAFLMNDALDGASAALFGLPTLISLIALIVTAGLLVGDLKRPDRFWYILARPNWSSWLTRGSVILGAYGALVGLGFLAWLLSVTGIAEVGGTFVARAYVLFGLVLGAATAGYTAFLFAQAKGRVLWMKRLYCPQLIAQALLAGSASVLVAQPLLDWDASIFASLRVLLMLGLAGHLVLTLAEPKLAPANREVEFARTSHLITYGPYSVLHWSLGIGCGVVLPLILLALAPVAIWPVAALMALAGMWIEEDLFVRAGQALPIS